MPCGLRQKLILRGLIERVLCNRMVLWISISKTRCSCQPSLMAKCKKDPPSRYLMMKRSRITHPPEMQRKRRASANFEDIVQFRNKTVCIENNIDRRNKKFKHIL
jgi:hypothetical protein